MVTGNQSQTTVRRLASVGGTRPVLSEPQTEYALVFESFQRSSEFPVWRKDSTAKTNHGAVATSDEDDTQRRASPLANPYVDAFVESLKELCCNAALFSHKTESIDGSLAVDEYETHETIPDSMSGAHQQEGDGLEHARVTTGESTVLQQSNNARLQRNMDNSFAMNFALRYKAFKDWRLGPVKMHVIDEKLKSGGNSRRSSVLESHLRSSTPPLSLKTYSDRFSFGIPKKLSWGVLHLFKVKTPAKDYASAAGNKVNPQTSIKGKVVGILGVPSTFSTFDFVDFIDPKSDIKRIRLVQDSVRGRYIALVYFSTRSAAIDFYQKFHGLKFSRFLPEFCQVIFISEISIVTRPVPEESYGDPFFWNSIKAYHSNDKTTLELPTCPVCLERMDVEITGLLAISCQHSYDCRCRSRWGDTRCPACRLTSSPNAIEQEAEIRVSSSSETPYKTIGDAELDKVTVDENQGLIQKILEFRPHTLAYIEHDKNEQVKCSICDTDNNIWMCVICGFVGCSRYSGVHAFSHFKTTSHAYALEVSTQRIWDYISDSYVHRVIHDKSSGKPVELDDPVQTATIRAHSPEGFNGSPVLQQHSTISSPVKTSFSSKEEATLAFPPPYRADPTEISGSTTNYPSRAKHNISVEKRKPRSQAPAQNNMEEVHPAPPYPETRSVSPRDVRSRSTSNRRNGSRAANKNARVSHPDTQMLTFWNGSYMEQYPYEQYPVDSEGFPVVDYDALDANTDRYRQPAVRQAGDGNSNLMFDEHFGFYYGPQSYDIPYSHGIPESIYFNPYNAYERYAGGVALENFTQTPEVRKKPRRSKCKRGRRGGKNKYKRSAASYSSRDSAPPSPDKVPTLSNPLDDIYQFPHQFVNEKSATDEIIIEVDLDESSSSESEYENDSSVLLSSSPSQHEITSNSLLSPESILDGDRSEGSISSKCERRTPLRVDEVDHYSDDDDNVGLVAPTEYSDNDSDNFTEIVDHNRMKVVRDSDDYYDPRIMVGGAEAAGNQSFEFDYTYPFPHLYPQFNLPPSVVRRRRKSGPKVMTFEPLKGTTCDHIPYENGSNKVASVYPGPVYYSYEQYGSVGVPSEKLVDRKLRENTPSKSDVEAKLIDDGDYLYGSDDDDESSPATSAQLQRCEATGDAKTLKDGLSKSVGDISIIRSPSARVISSREFEDLAVEYTNLMRTQMDSQREYYESLIDQLTMDYVQEGQAQSARLESLENSHSKLAVDLDISLRKNKELESKCKTLATKAVISGKALVEERALNLNLQANQDILKEKVESLEKQVTEKTAAIADMEEQIRDLMFSIEVSRLISGEKEGSTESQGGDSKTLKGKKVSVVFNSDGKSDTPDSIKGGDIIGITVPKPPVARKKKKKP